MFKRKWYRKRNKLELEEITGTKNPILIVALSIININNPILKIAFNIDVYLPIIIILLEYIVILILYIYSFNKFKKVDIYTKKAKEEKEKLDGLANYLKDYSLINKKDFLDIYLWERYLAYATIFNINHNILENLKISLEEKSTKENEKAKEIKFDFYENKYFYIDENDKKIYVEGKQ